MADGVWKGVYSKVFGRSPQLLQNKFLDPSTPSLRKGCVGEKNSVQGGYMLFKGVMCCSDGLYGFSVFGSEQRL